MLKRIESGEFGQSIKLRTAKNGRGDYGYTDLYLTDDNIPLLECSIDGARVDVQWKVGLV